MRGTHAMWVGAFVSVGALVVACSGDVASDSGGDAGQGGAAGGSSTASTSSTTTTATTSSTLQGTSTPLDPNPHPDDAGTPPPDPVVPPACAFEDTKFGASCRCTFDSGGHSYIIACDTHACVCDLDHGAALDVVPDPFESACVVAASGDWPGSIGCGYPKP